jgi:hypothetical protein
VNFQFDREDFMAEKKEKAKYFCYLDSGGPYTNLQLYSVKKAYDEWISLSSDYEHCKENLEHLKERLVFIVSCLGLSLSQLLGQNAVKIKKKLDRPDALLATFLNESKYGRDKTRLLNKKFNKFIEYYDACRHFGREEDNKKWEKVDSLNFKNVEEFMQTTLDIWNAVIGHHRSEHIEVDDIKDILKEYM